MESLPLTKATTLREAQNRLDPENPLEEPGELEAYFVSRQQSPLARVKMLLEDSLRPQKILFTGHRGSGKSTEMAKLAQELRASFLTISFSIKERVMSINDLKSTEVMLSLGLALFERALSLDVVLDPGTYTDLLNFTREIEQEFEQRASLHRSQSTEARVGAPHELAEVVSRIRTRMTTEEQARTVVREKMKVRVSDLATSVDVLARELEIKTSRKVLLVVMDLDKINLSVARGLFHDDPYALLAPNVNIIYTFPIALRRDPVFGSVKNNFPQVERLPNISIRRKDGTPYAPGLDALKDLLKRRVEARLFGNGALDELAKLSGGIPRELVKLSRIACLEARIRESSCIELRDVARAASREREEFEVRLDVQQRRRLAEVHETNAIDEDDDAHRELLQSLSLLEYRDPDAVDVPSVWYDVHPLALPLINELAPDGDDA